MTLVQLWLKNYPSFRRVYHKATSTSAAESSDGVWRFKTNCTNSKDPALESYELTAKYDGQELKSVGTKNEKTIANPAQRRANLGLPRSSHRKSVQLIMHKQSQVTNKEPRKSSDTTQTSVKKCAQLLPAARHSPKSCVRKRVIKWNRNFHQLEISAVSVNPASIDDRFQRCLDNLNKRNKFYLKYKS